MNHQRVCFLPALTPGGDMVKGDQWHEIHSRFKLKETKKSIARAVGLSVQTVRKILRQEEPRGYCREKQDSLILKPHRDYVLQRLAAVGYCAQAIYEELRVRGYQGSYQTVKRFVGPLRKEAAIEATVRFETPPSRKGQADWGQCWTIIAGTRVKVHLFVLTLGYSCQWACNNGPLRTSKIPPLSHGLSLRIPKDSGRVFRRKAAAIPSEAGH